ncbi:phage tail protein I [Pelosinus sp. IPA-1]|uniref:phage tail protein I n=1 Tax=Pelosinus sp. IPA-1 TaxID=3029569 RepID=UPI00243624A4|nr:phage tail protein I [Pelosinus sp. IPA-1]GMB00446.1 hypothetical protein PIPA1_32450 [Pelosinus sp. IPA-1]
MMNTLDTVKLIDVVPPSIAGDPQVQGISAAVSPQLQQVSAQIDDCLIMPRIDQLPENIVDLLAWQKHVDFYDVTLSIDQKRQLVKASIEAHRHKGTPYAVELVVNAIFGDSVVQEWFEYGGKPFYFRVIKIKGQVTADMWPRLAVAVNSVKNVRSWLEGVSLSRTINSKLYLGVGQSIHKKIDIFPVAFRMPDISSRQYLGGAINVHKKIGMR